MSTDSRTKLASGSIDREVQTLSKALSELAEIRDQGTAASLTRFFSAVVIEANKSARFSSSLKAALQSPTVDDVTKPTPAKRSNRRKPGPLNPFMVYDDVGAEGLKAALTALDLEQLRDIVSEHGMDNDRLAMKWKTPSRVIGRIIDRVVSRSSKGSAFR